MHILITMTVLSSSWFGADAPFIASWFIGPSNVTERASDDQRFGSSDNTIFASKFAINIRCTRTRRRCYRKLKEFDNACSVSTQLTIVTDGCHSRQTYGRTGLYQCVVRLKNETRYVT